jgi:hypothetical protein
MDAIGWPLRIALLIGVIFFAQHFWSISSVRLEPLPVNHDMPSFSDVAAEAGIEYDPGATYRQSVERAFAGLKQDCTDDALREFGHSVGWFYINAVGAAERAGATRLEDGPSWGTEEQRIHNFVGALANAGVLREEHFSGSELRRSKDQIPLAGGEFPHVYPEWAEPPLTLGCSRG